MRLDLIGSDLVCPVCVNDVPNSPPLEAVPYTGKIGVAPEMTSTFEAGVLHCLRCERNFCVEDGVGFFSGLPHSAGRKDDFGRGRYNSEAYARAYIQTHFRDVIADDEAARTHLDLHDITGFYSCSANNMYYRSMAEMLFTKLPPSATVLDLGCSVGRLSHELARRARVVVGADSSETHIRVAKAIQRQRRVSFRVGEAMVSGKYVGDPEIVVDVSSVVRNNVVFVVADEQCLPFRLFDGIVCSAVIERVPNLEVFLRTLRHRIHDGGLLLLSSPFDQDERFVDRSNWLGYGAYGTELGTAEESLRRLAQRLGFRPIGGIGSVVEGGPSPHNDAYRRDLRWVTYNDRRKHMVWSVHAELFEACDSL